MHRGNLSLESLRIWSSYPKFMMSIPDSSIPSLLVYTLCSSGVITETISMKDLEVVYAGYMKMVCQHNLKEGEM